MINISKSDYKYPLGIAGGYFSKKPVPPFKYYLKNHHIHFLNYLYYLLVMGAEGEYPGEEFSVEEITGEIEKVLKETPRKNKKCILIKKILIGEAPPENGDYFYDPLGKWSNSSLWYHGPMKCMFPGQNFPKKIDFLKACAKEGFLLLDLFPYAIKYGSRNTKMYKDACVSAFCGPYPINILNTLQDLLPFLNPVLSIGFGLTSFGQAILKNQICFAPFLKKNNISLDPSGPIDLNRSPTQKGVSDFLRICHKRGGFGPNAGLLKMAGF